MIGEALKERISRLEEALKGRVGEPVLLVHSEFEEIPRGGNPCFGGGGKDTLRKDSLELGILAEEAVRGGERKFEKPRAWSLDGLEISCPIYVNHEPLGYNSGLNHHPKLWARKERKILFPHHGIIVIGTEDKRSSDEDMVRLPHYKLLVGEQVPDFFSRSGFDRELKEDFYLDPSYVYALSLLGARDKAPEKFQKAYETFVEETTKEVIKVLSGKKEKLSPPNLRTLAIVAGLDKSDLMVNLGRGHYIKVAEAIWHLDDYDD